MPKKINLLDLFSGIGGFHKGLEQANFEFGWVGFSDIDKYANAVYQYNYPEAINLGSITTIRHKELPKIDCITFGSPCQDFSIAGKRSGMQGDRSSLITEAIRLIATLRPRFFIWENVKGTFSSNDGADFWAIIQAFTNIGGYRLEWQLLNTRWFLPQNRERIYLVGYTGEGSGQSIFPITESSKKNNSMEKQGKPNGQHLKTLTARGVGEFHSGMQLVESSISNFDKYDKDWHKDSPALLARDYKSPKIVKVVDKKLEDKNNQEYAACLSGGAHSGGNHSDMDLLKINIAGNLKGDGGHECHNVHDPMGIAPAVRENHGKITMVKIADFRNDEGLRIRKDQNSPTLMTVKHSETEPSMMPPLTIQPVLTPNRLVKRQHGRRFKEDGEDMFTITSQDQHGVSINNSKIRRLTPIECCRLQGFPDDWNEKGIIDGKVVKISDTQRYKQCGNAVTVDVVQAVAERIYAQETKSKNIS